MTHRHLSTLFIFLFALTAWFPQYASRGLWEPDEPRYTYVAWEMADSGQYAVPVRNGEFYAHKPPLMFWLIQVGTLLTGGAFNEISGRLPTLLGVFLALWAFFRMSTLWYDRRTAWWALGILCTSFLFWHKAGTGQIDMLLLGLEMCALWFLFRNDIAPGHWNSVVAFSFMGLAILAKGPVGLIVPCGIYVTMRIFSGEARTLLKKHWLWGIPLALAWPLLWLAWAKISGAPGAYFQELLFDQNLGRAQGRFGGHYKPFYYYLKYLIIDFMPWTFFLPVTAVVLRRQKNFMPLTRGLLGWILFVVVFFSLCGGKRNLYILSVYPAAALLTASALPFMGDVPDRLKRWSAFPLLWLLGILGTVLMTAGMVWAPISPFISLGGGILLIAGAFLLARLYRYIPLEQGWFFALILFLLFFFFYVGTVVFPALDPVKTPAAVSAKIAEVVSADQPILYYRMNGEIISLYAGRRGKRLDDKEALLGQMGQGRGVVVFESRHRDELMPEINRYGTIMEFRLGGKTIQWLAYGLPAVSEKSLMLQ